MSHKLHKIAPISAEMYNNFVFPDRDSYAVACKKKTEWVMRGRVESAFCDNLIFITLTYDNKYLPTTYKKVKDLKLFKQRVTRKKYSIPDVQEIVSDDIIKLDDEHINFHSKWVEKKSRPLNLSKNKYRTKEIFTEQDFKNAKFDFTHSDEYINAKRVKYRSVGLLVPQMLSDFLECLRNDMRNFYHDDKLTLRYIANGEYGQCTFRPHFHIVIFNHHKDYNFYKFVRTYWIYGRIIQCDTCEKTELNIKRLTAYICGHTVKVDLGNTYQNELSPPFKISSKFGGGIGSQLLDVFKCYSVEDSYVRSLSFSLSAWDKKSSVKYQTVSEGAVYEYEFPRFYKDKMLNYLALDIRQFTEARCRSYVNFITRFCEYANIKGTFDLLPLFHNIGFLSCPLDVLKFFIKTNYKKIAKKFGNCDYFCNIAADFLCSLKKADDTKREVFKSRYSDRKQQKKYDNYMQQRYDEIL